MNQDREFATRADNDRRAVRCWEEWEIVGDERRIVLCVETTLELRPGCAGFDPGELEGLIAEAREIMRASASAIDSIRIVPER
jgi:hypothetical protein